MDIGAVLGLPASTVGVVLGPLGGVYRAEQWVVSSPRLSLAERVEIALGIGDGLTFTVIAGGLGRGVSTVSREVNAHGGRGDYRPLDAHRAGQLAARRPKPTKLASCPKLREQVTVDLEQLWSPQQIARQLRAEFPDDPEMWVSHETIYKSLFVQGRGELRRELARCLRSGRARRRVAAQANARQRIPDMIMISQRPAEAEDRAVPGHWEGDLIIGARNQAQPWSPSSSAPPAMSCWDESKTSPPQSSPPLDHPADAASSPNTCPALPDLGPRHRDDPTRPVRCRHRRRRLLPVTSRPLAARLQREHQRAPASVHAQGHRPLRAQTKATLTTSPPRSTTDLDKPSTG